MSENHFGLPKLKLNRRLIMVATKTKPLNKGVFLALVNDFFEQFQNCCNRPNPPTGKELDKVLTSDFQLISNERVVVKNLQDYLKRIKMFRDKYEHFDIIGPLEEPIIADNKIALQYEIKLTDRDGREQIVCIIAFATIQDQKISRWQQVTHEKGIGTWDKP